MWHNGAIRVARLGGIAVDIHLTFGLVILWGAWQGWLQYGGLPGAAYGILAILLLFLCVLLHELGHARQARALGLVVRRVVLLPIGGLASLETYPAYPRHELVIALAGPLVNLGLAFLTGVLVSFLIPPGAWGKHLLLSFFSAPTFSSVLLYLLAANVILFLFNMLPAFPMDGGRVLRAGLALVLDYEVATRIAAWLGRLMAVGMAIIGAVGWPPAGVPPSPAMLVIAIVIFLGARHEELYVRRQRALVRVEVGDICQRSVETTAPWQVVTTGLIRKLFRYEGAMPVVVDGRLVGLLTYQDVQRGMRRYNSNSKVTVAHLMRTEFPVLKLRDTLWVAFREMDSFQLPVLPVVEDGVFHGVVNLDDINHAWRFVLRGRARRSAGLRSGDTVSK